MNPLKRAALFSFLLVVAAILAQCTLHNPTCPESKVTFTAVLLGFAYFGAHCFRCMWRALNEITEAS